MSIAMMWTQLTSSYAARLWRQTGLLLVVCAAVSLSRGASAQALFVDEMVLDHDGHSHRFELIDEFDATGVTGVTAIGADFSFTDIVDSDFTNATLDSAILDNTFLRLSVFSNADFTDATLRRAIVRAGDFDAADFTRTDLSNTQFSCLPDPAGDASSAFPDLCPSFISTTFNDADLTSTFFGPETAGDKLVFSAADFRGADLTGAVFEGISLPCLAPIAPDTAWTCMRWGDDPAPSPNTVVEGLTLVGSSDLRGSDLRNLAFEAADFTGAMLAGTRFTGSTLSDTKFDQIISACAVLDSSDPDSADEVALCTYFTDTPNDDPSADTMGYPIGIRADFRNAAISDSTFIGAALGGVDFTDATFDNVALDSVNLGCTASENGIDDFAEDCGDCADFSGVFTDTGLVAGKYNIRMRGVDFDKILACSALTSPGEELVDDLSFMDLDNASFKDANVAAAQVDFTGSSLMLANFDTADLSGVDFAGADLTLAILSGANMGGSNFDNAILDGMTALGGAFTNATFMGASTSLVGANLTSSAFGGAIFSGADLTGANFSSANLQGASFAGSNLSSANFSSADLRGTTFSGASDLSGAIFANAQIDAATNLGNSQIDGLNLSGLDLSAFPNFFLGTAAFVPGSGETASDARGVNLASMDLSGFDFSGLTLTNWNLNGANLTGVDFTTTDLNGAILTNLAFDEFLGSLVGTGPSTFAGVNFSGSDLSGLDLAGYDLSGANLTAARVTNTCFAGADLSNANLVSLLTICDGSVDCAEFTGANLYCADLTGTGFASFATRDGMGCTGNLNAAEELFQFVVTTDPGMGGIRSGIKLRNATLQDYNLSALDLRGADLQNSNVSGADFSGSMLDGVRLDGAIVCRTVDTTTTCADFSGASLVGQTDCDQHEAVDFSNTDFSASPSGTFDSNADFSCVNFTNADLSDDAAALPTGFSFDSAMTWNGAVLAGADLRYQDFSGLASDFFAMLGHAAESREDICITETQIIPAIDTTPDLRATNLSCANLTGQGMANADLSDAKLVRAILGGTGFNFTNAELAGADFADVDFNVANLASVFQGISKVKEDDGVTVVTDDDDDNDMTPEVPFPNLRGVSFAHANLNITVMGGPLDLEHVDLSDASLVGANLTGVILTNSLLDDIGTLCGTVAASTQSCDPIERATVSCLVIDGADIEGVSFENVDFTNLFLGGATAADFFQNVATHDVDGLMLPNLSRTNFNGANLAGMNLDSVDFTDAAFFGLAPVCDASACASFEKAIFGSSDSAILLNLAGRDFMTANISGATFNNVSLASADLTEVGALCTSDMTCVTISGKNSSLQNTDLSGLDLTTISFGTGADKVIDFRGVQLIDADLPGVDLSGRDFTGANFTAANLSGVNFEKAILADSFSGCALIDGVTECTNFSGANLCGVDARGATFEGNFANVDTSTTMGCTISATFSGATFTDIDFDASTIFSGANLDGASFDPSVTFCAAPKADCLNITGASLVGATLSGFDFDTVPDDYFANAMDDNLRQIDFSGSDLSGKEFAGVDFAFANLSESDLSGADLSNADFNKTQFALGAVSDGDSCTLAAGGTAVDLRGANLSGSDLSLALNFQRDCILVDLGTEYTADTQFPPGFDLLSEMTLVPPGMGGGVVIPEPNLGLLQATAVTLLALLALHRRKRRNPQS